MGVLLTETEFDAIEHQAIICGISSIQRDSDDTGASNTASTKMKITIKTICKQILTFI